MNWTLIPYVIGAFLFGWGCARIYYALTPHDWGSWNWSKNKWYIKYHETVCYICPRKHYCKAYADHKKEINDGNFR